MINRRSMLLGAVTLPVIAFAGHSASAQTSRIYNHNGVAIGGTDPVAYFNEGRPVVGDAAHRVEWYGAIWQFASQENLETFTMDARRFAPQYGGYCAYAVSQGYTASTVPQAWHIIDGKLYLNYSLRVRDLWEKDIHGYIKAADANWPSVLT